MILYVWIKETPTYTMTVNNATLWMSILKLQEVLTTPFVHYVTKIAQVDKGF